ncbi:hypothetical protein E3N88_43469 [Mikania micrantha]|uniref:Uncharacterized protein n=1 Tax=Mikania micrantha TaxID=192012 RepID=A0A5N6LH26_9ASTR|nr:hypothetical protein E3N88_43469 [Mikania micrantha]
MDTQFPFSPFFFIACIFFFFITIIITGLKSLKSLDANRKLPPQPWKLPLIGHIHHLVGGPPHRVLRNIAQKLGPIVHLQLGQVSAIVISSPTLAKEIMKTHDVSFANRPKLLSAEIVSYNYTDIAFSPYGDYWRQMRKICVLELLSAKKVQSFRSVREQESQNLIDWLAMQRFNVVNLSHMIFMMMSSITCRITFGSRFDDQEMLVKTIQKSIEASSGFDVSDLFPSVTLLALITGTRGKLLKIRNKIDGMLDRIISDHQERRVGQKNHHENEDLVDVLMRLKDDDSLQFPLPLDSIKSVILDMFSAGTDTSAVTIEWAMSELMKNPRVMKKVKDELMQAFKGKKTINELDIQELDYLKLVIKETLRLHPPAPFLLPRECRESCEIAGYHIPVKTKVIINAWMIGRDPDYWTDPESFIPERFSESSVTMMGTDFEFIPFGAGRRMCPGTTMGLANVELPLAKLLYHFDWELPNGAPAEDLDMFESFGAILKRKNNLLLVPRPYDTNSVKSLKSENVTSIQNRRLKTLLWSLKTPLERASKDASLWALRRRQADRAEPQVRFKPAYKSGVYMRLKTPVEKGS